MSEHLYRWLFLYAGDMLPRSIKKWFIGSSLLCQGEQEQRLCDEDAACVLSAARMFTSRTRCGFALDVSLKTTTKLVLLFILSCTYNFNDFSCENTKSVRVSSSSSAPCPTADPWRTELVRGRSQELGFGEGGAGIQMLFFPRELNNFKVHLGERLQTYFSTLGSLFVAACPLYVCLSQCESESLCYSSVQNHPSAFMQPEDERLSAIFLRKKNKNKQAVKGWIEMLLWASVRKVVKRFHGRLSSCSSGFIKWPWIARRPNGASLR